MSPLDLLLWAVAIIAGVIALSAVVGTVIVLAAMVYGFAGMAKDKRNNEKQIFKGGGDR